MKIEIFEPNLCCSTGVCGPAPDKDLVNLNEMTQTAKKAGVTINRYAINQQPLAFTSNNVIREYIRENGTGNFPVTLIDGEIVKEKAYPSWEELRSRIPALSEIKPATTIIGTF
jgi:hypothetical protein